MAMTPGYMYPHCPSSAIFYRANSERNVADIIEGCTTPASRLETNSYSQQFSQIYFCRLKSLLPHLRSNANSKWMSSAQDKGPVFVDRVLDISPETDSVIFGTIYAHLPNKPNVLRDLEGDV